MLILGLFVPNAAAARGEPPDAEIESSAEESVEWVQELPLGETPVDEIKGGVRLTAVLSSFDFSGDHETEVALEAEYGLTDRLQLQASMPYVWTHQFEDGGANGIGDIEIGALYSLVTTDRFLLSVSLDVALPTGDSDEGLGGGSVTYLPKIASAIAIKDFQLIGSIGASLGSGEDAFQYSAALARPFGQWVPLVEIAGEISEEESTLYAVPAVAWRPGGGWEILLGVPLGLTSDSADVGIAFKVTFEH